MSTISYLFSRPPQWKTRLRGAAVQAPPPLLPWLNETGSLTKRLRGVYGNTLAVKLLFHHWKPAFAEECQALRVPHHRYQLIREVLLHVGDKPLVLARTVLPEPTIRIAHRNLSHLGTRPLGEVIFAYPDLELRQRYFSAAVVHCWSAAVQSGYRVEQTVWGRRTLYAIHHQPLLVSEFFLPAMLEAYAADGARAAQALTATP
ncbi:chorismate lyase [Methylomonas sp. SURF-2]|uniref:Probable chorismate pyruvate-lyase n=1 Tax=Methylomonas subterranea TaxID=2952225 RepID=A0ABT1TCX8_9GAMM|nr:chorismate lyase [Methylomonas sp. SURF-2]MCQ8103315.1 chorismate lyase [Methylomonas sp. SURF-2]